MILLLLLYYYAIIIVIISSSSSITSIIIVIIITTIQLKMTPTYPQTGTIMDMEEMDLKTKLSFLKEHQIWKCMNKTELFSEHESTWKTNGLNNLKYEIINRKTILNDNSEMITVDVQLNDHWTDLVCAIDDSQLSTSVEKLKDQFESIKNKKK